MPYATCPMPHVYATCPMPQVIWQSDSSLSCMAPAARSGSYDVKLTLLGSARHSTIKHSAFTMHGPTITGLHPKKLPATGGVLLTIHGKYFGKSDGAVAPPTVTLSGMLKFLLVRCMRVAFVLHVCCVRAVCMLCGTLQASAARSSTGTRRCSNVRSHRRWQSGRMCRCTCRTMTPRSSRACTSIDMFSPRVSNRFFF